MFRIWKFGAESRAFWVHASKARFKQSFNHSSNNSRDERDKGNNDCALVGSAPENKQRHNGSNTRHRCHKKICFDFYHFYYENYGLKVGVVGAIHHVINHWQQIETNNLWPFQKITNFPKYFLDNFFQNVESTSCNVFPKSNSQKYLESVPNNNINGFSEIPESFPFVNNHGVPKHNGSSSEVSINKLFSTNLICEDILTERDLCVIKETEQSKHLSSKELSTKNLSFIDELKNIMLDLQCDFENNKAVQLAEKGNYNESIKIWKLILDINPSFLKANFNLAICYQEGFGVAQDIQHACKLYEKLISSGHIASSYNLAVILLKQSSINIDNDAKTRAYWLLNDAAEKGSTEATDALILLSLGYIGKCKQKLENKNSSYKQLEMDKIFYQKPQLIRNEKDILFSLEIPAFNRYEPISNKEALNMSRHSGADSSSDRSSYIVFTDDDNADDMQEIIQDNGRIEKIENYKIHTEEYILLNTNLLNEPVSRKVTLRNCHSENDIQNSDDSGNGSDSRVKNFYLLGDFGSYSTDMILVKQ